MDSGYSLQDVVRCNLCETPCPTVHCYTCDIHLCDDCKGEHLLDLSKKHRMIPFKLRLLRTICKKHSSKFCERYCEQCNIPICVHCAAAKTHRGHTFFDVVKTFESKKQVLQRDLHELEKIINPKFQDIASSILFRKGELKENSKKLISAVVKHGEDLHREIDTTIQSLKSNIQELESKHMIFLDKQDDEIQRTISRISNSIAELNRLLNSNDVSLVFAHESKNSEFKRLPPKLTITLPSFTPQKMIHERFGYLSVLSIRSEEQDFLVDLTEAGSSSPDRPLIDDPRIITEINTEYGESNGLCSVSCQSDEEIWTGSFNNNTMRLYNLQGELVKSIKTKARIYSSSTAVTSNGNLVVAELDGITVQMSKNKEMQIRSLGRKFLSICSTASDELLVVMSDDENSKVVRYSGFKEKQIIQYHDDGQPLYSTGYTKYINENTNRDICVSDRLARAVVVVSHLGKLRFTYAGLPTTNMDSFDPIGITTDSQSRILIADRESRNIHILDHDGQFIRFIDNCNLVDPWGVCVDTRDNLFVAEWRTGKVRKIQYCM